MKGSAGLFGIKNLFMPTINNFPYKCDYTPHNKPSVKVTCSGCRKLTGRVIIPEKGKPNIFQCSFCEHKMIIFGFGNSTGAFVYPVEGQPAINRIIRGIGDAESVSNNFTFEVLETLSNCYTE
jgi:hypothetical protein